MTDIDKENFAELLVQLVIKDNCQTCNEKPGTYRDCRAQLRVLKPSEKCLKEIWEEDDL